MWKRKSLDEMIKKGKQVIFAIGCVVLCILLTNIKTANAQDQQPPNILFIISDDQGYPHASAYGCDFVNTPTFDSIAQEGILFNNFFVCAPQCSPSRASILTGQFIWQNGPAGTHWSGFPARLITYTDILKQHGYEVGYTGKGWEPGNWIDGGRTTNPVGIKYIDTKDAATYNKSRPASGISRDNYAGSFQLFLNKRNTNKPFCFWLGGREPHRRYEQGSGLKHGKKLSDVKLPPYLPDNKVVKSDILDYALEIEWFDKQAGKVLKMLEEKGLLNNTLVVFTSDNGMSFPRAKALCFDAGNHVPLAIMWKHHIKNPGRTVNDLISAVDLFPTILEAAGLKDIGSNTEGESLFDIFQNGESGLTDKSREYVFWGRERHTDARWDNLGYPQRAVRSHHYLYIWNLKPERYPVGSPKKIEGDTLVWAYEDYGDSPTKAYMIHHQGKLFQMAFGKFPEEMLYNIKKDPYCMHNLAKDPDYLKIKNKLSSVLKQKLKETNDPRLGENPNVWESYRRYGPLRRFPRPEWADSIVRSQVVRE